MNSGYKRLAIIFLVFSTITWGFIDASAVFYKDKSEKSFNFWANIFNEELKPYANTPIDELPSNVPSKETRDNMDEAAKLMWANRRWLTRLLWLTLAWFVVPPLFVASGVWIHRGFSNSN